VSAAIFCALSNALLFALGAIVGACKLLGRGLGFAGVGVGAVPAESVVCLGGRVLSAPLEDTRAISGGLLSKLLVRADAAEAGRDVSVGRLLEGSFIDVRDDDRE